MFTAAGVNDRDTDDDDDDGGGGDDGDVDVDGVGGTAAAAVENLAVGPDRHGPRARRRSAIRALEHSSREITPCAAYVLSVSSVLLVSSL